MQEVKIGKFTVGENTPSLIMVDAGVNHNNSIDRGIEIINLAADSGAEIIKFQTYKAASITTKTAPRYWADYLNTDTGEGTQYDTFSKLDGMSLEGYKEFKKCCIERGVVFSSTPFNLSDVDILEEIGMDVYKISSSDITYLQLIDYISRSGKPIIISTGCASLSEIEKAVDTVHKTGNNQVILQHCILQYPCDYKNANLNKMIKIQEVFSDIPVGYSDHTIGTDVPCAAIAMGAKTIEKHFTIDKKLPNSPDHKLSANPEELARLVESRNRIEEAKGIFISGPYPAEEKAFQYARKSLVASANILAGTKISSSMLTCKRPGTGIYPEYFDWVDGLIAKVDILEDTTITKEMIS